MTCKKCKIEPVIQLTGNNVKLCKSCFIRYFEKKAISTIRKYKLLDKNDSVGVGVSSGKDSFNVLYILNKLAEKRINLKIKAIALDEGIKGYRYFKRLEKYCKENDIDLSIYSFKKEFGMTLDQMSKKTKLNMCSVCGVLRRFLLNKKAKELKVNKLATGHNLDDEAQSVLMNQLKGNLDKSSRLGPITGIISPGFAPRIKPLYFLTEKESKIYSYLKKFPVDYNECPYAEDSFRADIRNVLNDLEMKYPGTKNAIVNSFLKMHPYIRKMYVNRKMKYCKKCKEPTAQDVCQTCLLIKKLKS